MTIYLLEWLNELISTNSIIKFYKSTIWEKKKKYIHQRDNNECQLCKKEGRVTTKHQSKLDIHHIKELKQYPELALSNDNLITVCVYHHNILDNKNNMVKTKLLDNEERWD